MLDNGILLIAQVAETTTGLDQAVGITNVV